MTQLITGETRFIAHLGLPTRNFKAPMIYNPYFEDRGIDVVVVPMGCAAADFAAFLPLVFRMSNIAGALITMPHKVSVLDLLDAVSATARICGAANAVKRDAQGRLVGDMFDGEGFVRAVIGHGRPVAGSSALVVGTGGAGSAIAASLAGAGIVRLGLFDDDGARAEALAGRIRAHYPNVTITLGSNDPAGWAIVANATPLGMSAGDPAPVDTARLAPETFACDVVMNTAGTRFLDEARARGCDTQVGTDMLFNQINAYLEFFALPTAPVEELRRLARLPG